LSVCSGPRPRLPRGKLDPGLVGAHVDLATILFVQMRNAEGLDHLDQAVRLEPDNGILRSCRVLRTLPLLPRTAEEADEAVRAFDSALREYSAWRFACRDAGATVRHDRIFMMPFLLAYRDGNHVDLLSRFADDMGPPRAFAAQRYAAPRPRVRLGIVSAHFRRHSVWDVITKGILAHLDRSRFEVYLYHTGSQEDGETALARSMCDRWTDSKSVVGAPQWAAEIEKDQLDVLFYPELGMELTTYLIARERLAAVQAVGWGHPITSGLSTMDLFMSGDLFEPPDAQSHYRERLVRLPGTGACTAPLVLPDEPPRALLDDLAARPGPTLLVPQMFFKFDPRFDALLARTVELVGPCTVVIPVDRDLDMPAKVLVDRLGSALRTAGCDPDAVLKLIPWLHRNQFNALLDASDVMLDCPFSGYTTAWLAAHRGTPVVSRTGPCLRHRLATGLYRKMGIAGTIVDSDEAYVRVAAALAKEGRGSAAGQARRQAIRAAASSTDGDLSVVRAIELAFLQALDERRSP